MSIKNPPRRLAAAATLLGAVLTMPVSAKDAGPEPMMDYGVGQFATIEQYGGLARSAADDAFVMDYGVGRYATIAAWTGTGSKSTAAASPAPRVLAKH